MAIHNQTGALGEEMAARYLTQNGYEILNRNYRWGRAEVDIIARTGNLLLFVEVKTRSTVRYGLPETFVSPRKVQLFQEAAEEYITQTNWQHDIRFDIIAVTITSGTCHCHHIADAFH